jgi:hypothetical protein
MTLSASAEPDCAQSARRARELLDAMDFSRVQGLLSLLGPAEHISAERAVTGITLRYIFETYVHAIGAP